MTSRINKSTSQHRAACSAQSRMLRSPKVDLRSQFPPFSTGIGSSQCSPMHTHTQGSQYRHKTPRNPSISALPEMPRSKILPFFPQSFVSSPGGSVEDFGQAMGLSSPGFCSLGVCEHFQGFVLQVPGDEIGHTRAQLCLSSSFSHRNCR